MCVCVCEDLARNGPSADGDRIGNSETVWSTTCALRRQWCEVLTRTKSTCNLQTLNEMGCCCCCCCFCTSSQMRCAFVLFSATPQQQRTGKHQQVPKLLPTQLAWSRSTCALRVKALICISSSYGRCRIGCLRNVCDNGGVTTHTRRT